MVQAVSYKVKLTGYKQPQVVGVVRAAESKIQISYESLDQRLEHGDRCLPMLASCVLGNH
jgi:hypothetical protein